MTPLTAALVAEARRVAPLLDAINDVASKS
jgi:hypothetical protein